MGKGLNRNAAIRLFHDGLYFDAFEFLGAHPGTKDNKRGTFFRVFAPGAERVSVVGDFNGWDTGADPCQRISEGIYEAFVRGVKKFDAYKFAVTGKDQKTVLKSDPYATHFETRPGTASKVFFLDREKFEWTDRDYMNARRKNLYMTVRSIFTRFMPAPGEGIPTERFSIMSSLPRSFRNM